MSCATLCLKQSTAAYEHTAPAVGKKAEVADADQALGQNMDQKAAQDSSEETVMIFWLPPCA
jgi:hypothetical protein